MTGDFSPQAAAALDDLEFLTDEELCAQLNELLEAERAGTLAVRSLARTVPEAEKGKLLAVHRIGRDEGRFCRMLTRQITRLGGLPSRRRGAFAAKVAALDGFEARLELIIKGQRWVERRVDAMLPRIRDGQLYADLRDMRDVHEVNVAACEALRARAARAEP
jgi:hypothetical protein